MTGGARSGKSGLALELARERNGRRVFVATATACDEEMVARIENHRVERGTEFETVEEPLDLATTVANLSSSTGVAVVDCLTVWLGNLYHHFADDHQRIQHEIDRFVDALAAAPCEMVLVTNELGWGVVPPNKLARLFRDTAGRLNRRVADIAGTVILVVCGQAIAIKGGERT